MSAAAVVLGVGAIVVPALGTPPTPDPAPSVVRLHMGTDGDHFALGSSRQRLGSAYSSCRLTSSATLIDVSASHGDPGLVKHGLGVQGGRSGSGTPCGQVSGSEALTLQPGSELDGRTFSKVRLDLEMTKDAYVELTLARGYHKVTYKLQSGYSTTAAQRAEHDYDSKAPYTARSGPGDEVDACAAANSSGPNSWGNDNCLWTVEPGFDFDTITLSTKVGTVALEGGADFGNSPHHESLFHLSNTGPVAVDDAVSTDEDTPVSGNVLVNDTDADGDALSVTSSTAPAHGAVSVASDGTFTYTPDPDRNGPDSFTYTVSDGHATDEATVAVTVTPVNDAPVAQSGSTSTPEDTSITITVATDIDSSALTATCDSSAGGDLTDHGDGTVTYVPPADFVGTDTLVCSVADDQGATTAGQATVTVGVSPVNDAPVAVDDTADVDEGASVDIDVLANDHDVDGDALAVGTVSDPANGTATSTGTAVTYTPDPGFTGEDTFTYTADDGTAASDVATVTVTVVPVLCSGETVSDVDGEVSGAFTRLTDSFDCKRYELEAVDDDGTILFRPEGAAEVSYRGFLQLDPSPAPVSGGGGAFSLLLEYDPTGGTAYRPVEWCIDPQFDDDDMVTTATVPAGETWCIAGADLRGNVDGDIVTVWQVFGVDDPRFK